MYRFLIFLSSTVILITCLPLGCDSPSVRDRGVQCVNQLTPIFDRMNMIKSQGFSDGNFIRDLNNLCTASLDCFKTLQNCASIDNTLILNLDGVCDLYGFINGKFNDCFKKLLDTQQDSKCINGFFLDPVYTDAKNPKAKCDSLKNDGKCVKKRAESVCSKDKANDFENHLDGQLKRFSCF